MVNGTDEDGCDVSIITEVTRARLNQRQLLDYQDHRKKLIEWMLNIGKDPDEGKGYAASTTRRRGDNLDAFYRWVWDEQSDGYTTNVTHEHAEEFTKHLRFSDYGDSHKSNLQKSVIMLFRWRAFEFGEEEWNPSYKFNGSTSTAVPKDYFTKDERSLLREAALEYDTVPHYNAITPQERKEWKRILARRLGKPMGEIGKADFESENGFKIPSLVYTSLDAGLRPDEVANASTSWIDTDNHVLRIPSEEASKNSESFDGTWIVSLRETTSKFLDEWLDERAAKEKYDDTDRLWLTREKNPYQSTSLSYLLDKLCELADIDDNGRSLTWYAIRHSTGTYMSNEGGLASAQAQLRHVSSRTTMKYDQTPVEERRDNLENIG